jgi:type II secretory pathway pseudopilin PulG
MKGTSLGERVRRRRGWTLLEAIAALTVGSTIFGIAVQLLALTMHAAEGARDRATSAGATARLAERFRADVHAAREIVVPQSKDNMTRWTVKLSADERIEYELRDGSLQWTKYVGDAVRARDALALPQDTAPRLELEPKDNPVMASLLLKRGAEAGDDSAEHTVRIDARIGRDRRFFVESRPPKERE